MEPIQINSVEDLQRAKNELRQQISNKEQDLKQHYKTLSQQIAPALKIANFVSGNRLFNSALGSNEDKNDSGWLSSAMKIMTAVSAAVFILKKKKKNLAKALLAYALDQGVKYIKEHDLSEHIDKLKKWLNLDTEQTANNQQDTGSDEA